MDPRQLRHFIALVEERSFTRAAAREFIVQSGLSSSIRSLEADLGVAVYVKGSRPVRLTAEGEALIPAARYALEALESTYQAVNVVSGRLTGHLRIGVFQNIDHLVPIAPVLANLVSDFPQLELTLRQLPSREMIQMVSSGELDCAIVSALSEHAPGVEIRALAQEPLELALSADHPLARRGSLAFADLNGAAFVETTPGFATRHLTDAAFSAAGYERKIVCEATEWSMVVDLVSAGIGVAFLPQGVARPAAANSNVTVLPVSGVHLVRRIDLATPGEQASSPATRELATRLRASVSNGTAKTA